MSELAELTGGREIVMVSNRLPVERVVDADGTPSWRTSPGGLVTAIQPIVEQLGCTWVGWGGVEEERIEPFAIGSMRLVPVDLDEEDIELYYEGFSNGTLWPLYHDVIVRPEFHREWWQRYVRVNELFAKRIAAEAAQNVIAWVHDYQLQLVPAMLRKLRPDLTIAFFLHIPFPPARLFEQLPWRRRIIEGLIGADVIGFQQASDAAGFRESAERLCHTPTLGNTLQVVGDGKDPDRTVLAQEFPISIDADAFAELARRPEVRRRAQEIRAELGSSRTLMLGVDRLDYTKGIGHRLKAYEELLLDGELDPEETVLVQVASPSREGVHAYQHLRDEVEATAGRINGAYGSTRHTPLVYLHRDHSRTEMVALYLAVDVLLVTPLRDGMNLVAKEYVACRTDEQGVLVLSEFAGAAEELRDALLVNPHDVVGLKAAILRAIHMPPAEQRRRMRALRQTVGAFDVAHWAAKYLGAVRAAAESNETSGGIPISEPINLATIIPQAVEDRVRHMATLPKLIVASDFDGTLAPLVERPQDARMLPRTRTALAALKKAPGTEILLITGRSLAGLVELGVETDGWIVGGSHGAEFSDRRDPHSVAWGDEAATLTHEELARINWLSRRFELVFRDEPGVRIERKSFGLALHARQMRDPDRAQELLAAASALGRDAGMHEREGKLVREFTARKTTKADAFMRVRAKLPDVPVLFLGDDVTDEDVFRALTPDDFGIKVGPGVTAAHERVANPAAVTAVLALLAELRNGIIIDSLEGE